MTTSGDGLTKRFYDRIARAYDLLADAGEHAVREQGLTALAAQPGESVLEIGYGTGHSLVALARSVGDRGRVCGVDISDGMYQIARWRVANEGVGSRVELRVAEAPPVPYDDASFDAAFMAFTLELFPLDTIPRVLAEVRRVLCDGGRIGVVSMATTPAGQKDSLLERTYKWMHQHFPHIVDCQPIDVVGAVRGAGFTVTQHITLEIWTLPVAAVVGVV